MGRQHHRRGPSLHSGTYALLEALPLHGTRFVTGLHPQLRHKIAWMYNSQHVQQVRAFYMPTGALFVRIR